MDWLKWWHGTVTDPKFQRVARISGACVAEVLAVWACLLECASAVSDAPVTACDATCDDCDACDDDVTRGNVTRFDCDDHDVLLGFADGKTTAIVTAMTARGLIENGRIARWDDRQPNGRESSRKRRDSSTERTRAYRQRMKGKSPVTPSDAPVTPGVTVGDGGDAQERDKEGDKDKSNNPLSPPAGENPASKSKPAPKPKPAKAPATKAKPRRQLPEPFLTSLDLLAWAAERVPAVNLDLETERFVNYWRAEGKTKADWDATWRNWMLRAQDSAGRTGPRPGGGGFVNRQQQIEDANDAVVREIARKENERRAREQGQPASREEFIDTGELIIEGEYDHA